MSTHRIRELTDKCNHLSHSFATKATELSKKIEAFENQLKALEGKIETEVRTSAVVLSFQRANRDDWQLSVPHNGKLIPLTDASLDIKIKAVSGFEPLLEAMITKHERMTVNLTKALDTIEGFVDDRKGA